MTTEALDAIRERAAALLAAQPWVEVASRGLLVLVRPPATPWANTSTISAAWLILDGVEARALPPEFRGPVVRDGALRLPASAADGLELAVMTSEGVGRALDGVTRRSLEMRWMLRHSVPLHDPLHRHDSLVGAAGRLPEDALERAVRPLYVQAAAALGALTTGVPSIASATSAFLLLGEAAGALTRLACVLDDGSHPPPEWLAPAARETRLGKRIAPWLDDLGPAAGGDDRAAGWIREASMGVLREAASVLQVEFAGRDWFTDPESYALRTPR